MKNISIKQKNGTILFRMVKHEVGKKQKRKGGNTRLPTFGGCYCQQKARNGKEQILKRWRKMILCLDMVQIMNQKWKVLFFFLFLKKFFIITFFLLYNIVLVLPYINMHPPQVYTCSPSWTPLPPPSPYHPSGLKVSIVKGPAPKQTNFCTSSDETENTADWKEGNYNISLKTLKKDLKN